MNTKDALNVFILLTLGLVGAILIGYWLQYLVIVLSFALFILYNEYLNLKRQLPKKKPTEMEKKFGSVIIKVRDVPGGYLVIFTDDKTSLEWITMTYGDFEEAVRWINETINHLEVIKKEVKMENDSGRRYRV